MREQSVGPATILVEDGVIEAVVTTTTSSVASAIEPALSERLLDLGDLVISPGLVDCHVHINEPGRTEWEGFATATRAAAAGGVTSVVDMPLNSSPVTIDRAALEIKVAASEGQRFVDVGFWGGVVPGNTPALAGLAELGALGCKAFLIHSGIDDFPNATKRDLLEAMPVLKALGLPLLAHAELDLGPKVGDGAAGAGLPSVSDPGRRPHPRAYEDYLRSRPPAWEDQAIALLVELCRTTGCSVHIVHLSSASSLPLLRAARAEGLPVTVETCPHYLCLESESIPDGATQFKCAPPIRDHANRDALWQGLFDGVIDFVITDHSPCTPQLKAVERGDFQEAWGGIASLSLGLAAIWTEASSRGATLPQMATWMSTRPAAFAGLGNTKGRIAPGFDADLVVWDPDESFVVSKERLFFRHPVSPYLGSRLRGVVRRTFLRGREIYDGVGHPAGPIGKVLLQRDRPGAPPLAASARPPASAGGGA